MRLLGMLGVSCLVCALFGSFAATAQAQRYRMTDLGVAPGQDPPHDDSQAFGINNRGQVLGRSRHLTAQSSMQVSFIWENGTWTILYPEDRGPGRPGAFAHGINENGIVCGAATTLNFYPNHAVLWMDKSGEPTDIHVLGNESSAFDLNDDLVVCGMFWFNLFPVYPFMWRDGVMTQLRSPPPGGPFDRALAVNNHGDIVGSGAAWPVLWPAPDYPPIILETLPIDFGTAEDINEDGTIVGIADESLEDYYGAIWEGTRLVRLLPRPGAPEFSSTADAVNARGEVVVGARVENSGPGKHTFIWREGVLMDLQELVGPDFEKDYFSIYRAYGINDEGQIAATAVRRIDGRGRAVLLDPFDEGFAVWSITPDDAGVQNTIEVVNATPGGMVFLVFGVRREGETPVPGCPDAKIEIRNPRLLGVARADSNGRAELSIFVPQQAARKSFVLQAIDRAGCEVSPPAWTLFMDR